MSGTSTLAIIFLFLESLYNLLPSSNWQFTVYLHSLPYPNTHFSHHISSQIFLTDFGRVSHNRNTFYISFSSIWSHIVVSFPQSPVNNLFLLLDPRGIFQALPVSYWYLQNSSSVPFLISVCKIGSKGNRLPTYKHGKGKKPTGSGTKAKMPQQLVALFIMYGCHLVNWHVESQRILRLGRADLSLAFSSTPVA